MTPNFIKALTVLALAAAGLLACTKPAHAADVHVCAAVKQNLGTVYDKVESAPVGADMMPLLVSILNADGVPDEEKAILVAGLQFAAANWGHPDLNRNSFIAAGFGLCVQRHGPVEDRNHV